MNDSRGLFNFPPSGTSLGGPSDFVYVKDPMAELAQSTGAILRQYPDYIGASEGVSSPNRYDLFLASPMGLKYAFKINELSTGCARCCCVADCRECDLLLQHIISYSAYSSGDAAKTVIRVHKPCEYSYCCLCRPLMDVMLSDSGQFLGSIKVPFSCCDSITHVLGPNGELRYVILGDGNATNWADSDVKKMADIEFQVLRDGNQCASIRKLSSAGYGEFFTNADTYQIAFPLNSSPYDKILLIISTLMIDYQYFEHSGDSDYKHRSHHHHDRYHHHHHHHY